MEKAHLYEASYLVNHGIDESVREVQRLKWPIGKPRVSRNTPMNVQLLQEVIELNQAFGRVVEGLKRMEKVSFLQFGTLREDRAEVVLAQIDFNPVFFRDFHKDYEGHEKWVADFQRACLAKRCDPEDDYIGVRQREEARKKKGPSSRVVFLPDWHMRDEQGYDETQTECRKKTARNPLKKVAKPKPKRNERPGDLTPAPAVETNGPRETEAQS
jgi:hypothetical protein